MSTNTGINLDFEFTEVMLAREVLDEQPPSAASGLSQASFNRYFEEDPDMSVVWLLEPARTSSTTRYSGTMAHTNQSNKHHQTINTFVHFSYLFSQRSMIFADIESALSCSIGVPLLIHTF